MYATFCPHRVEESERTRHKKEQENKKDILYQKLFGQKLHYYNGKVHRAKEGKSRIFVSIHNIAFKVRIKKGFA